MKQFNFFTLCLAFLFFATGVNAQITVSPWQIHEGKEGVIDFKTKFHGDPAAYDKASIPAANDSGWSEAPTDAKGNVSIDRRSSLKCNQQLDFTYFQASVNIPENSTVDKFTVSYNKADDGARIYIFNSANSTGAFDAGADLQFDKKNTGNVDLKQHVKKGEVNRVVIVQFDDCGVGNTLNGINIEVNGKVIEVAPVVASSNLVMECQGSKSGAKVSFVSKEGQTIKLKVDWDEGATFVGSNLDITNGVCETCPAIGGIGRPHGKEATYIIKQTNPSEPVIVKWGGNAGNRKYCGEDRSLVIPVKGATGADAFDANKCYRLTCQWQGEGKALDVVNDAKDDKLQLANTGKYTGQYWKITPLGDGYYRLTNQFQGEGKSLDIINDGKNNRLQLANTGKYTGQAWKFTPLGNGYYRLTTRFTGEDKSLDVINDGKNNQLQMAKTGKYSGQAWKLTELDCLPVLTSSAPAAPVMEVAKGKSARQSSTRYDANGAAANAVDGNKKGAWSWNNNTLTHTQDENSPWWEVDLGEVYDISKIEIWNRTDCCWDRLKNFYIMVSETPITANSTSQDQFIGGAHSFTSGDHPSMILEGKKRGRYVRIFKQSDSKSPLTLAEVEIYGSK